LQGVVWQKKKRRKREANRVTGVKKKQERKQARPKKSPWFVGVFRWVPMLGKRHLPSHFFGVDAAGGGGEPSIRGKNGKSWPQRRWVDLSNKGENRELFGCVGGGGALSGFRDGRFRVFGGV